MVAGACEPAIAPIALNDADKADDNAAHGIPVDAGYLEEIDRPRRAGAIVGVSDIVMIGVAPTPAHP